MTQVFCTDRLIARRWESTDVEGILRVYGSEEVNHFLRSQVVRTHSDAETRLATVLERNRDRPPGMGGFALVANEDGSIVGTILLKPLPTSGLIEVGWHIALDCWGRGYATESGKAAITYGFNKLGLDRIYAVIDPLNHRSAEVARRCEMALQGKIFEYDLDLDLYSIDRGV